MSHKFIIVRTTFHANRGLAQILKKLCHEIPQIRKLQNAR